MTKYWVSIGVLLLVVTFLAGCASGVPVPVPPAPAAPAAAPAAPALSPEEVAWARVVQEAKKEGTVTVYGYIYAAEIGQAVRQAFKERYGIKVETLAVAGRTALEKVKVEQAVKQPIADSLTSGFSACWDLAVLNLADKVADQLPELRDPNAFKTEVLDFGGQFVNLGFSQSDVLINSKQVKPEDYPKSYYDLLEPKWKGQKILLSDPRTGANSTWSPFATSIFYKALDLDYWRRLMKQQPVLQYGAPAQTASGVARGEYLMSMSSADSVAHMIVEGAPLKFLALKEGSWASGSPCAVVIKNTAHPNAARLFVNWFLSKEGQEVYYKAASDTPIRKDVPDFMPLGARPEPHKLFMRTVEAHEAAVKLLKAGVVEEIFTPK